MRSLVAEMYNNLVDFKKSRSKKSAEKESPNSKNLCNDSPLALNHGLISPRHALKQFHNVLRSHRGMDTRNSPFQHTHLRVSPHMRRHFFKNVLRENRPLPVHQNFFF